MDIKIATCKKLKKCKYQHVNVLIIILVFLHISTVSLTAAESCIYTKTVNQTMNIHSYYMSSLMEGNANNAYDGNLITFVKWSTGSDKGFHWILLYNNAFLIVKTVTVHFGNISSISATYFNKVYLLNNEPKYKNDSSPQSARLTDSTWNDLIPCHNIASTNTTSDINASCACNTNNIVPTKYILVTFNETASNNPTMNEIFFSEIDLNIPVSPPSPTDSWLVTCSRNSTSPSCSDYVICNNDTCWNSSSISLSDLASRTDPRGPYYCRLRDLPNQLLYMNTTESQVLWFPNRKPSNFTFSSNISAGSAIIEYTFSCACSESLPVNNLTITVNTSYIHTDNQCQNETISIEHKAGSFGGQSTKTVKTVTLCSNNNITILATCHQMQNTSLRETLNATIEYVFLNGNWSEWSNGTCEVTCGNGTLIRQRFCNNPAPRGTGLDCEGEDRITEKCATNIPCPEPTTTNPTSTKSIPTSTTTLTTAPTEPPIPNNTGIIIGIIIGVTSLILFVVFIVMCVIYKNRSCFKSLFSKNQKTSRNVNLNEFDNVQNKNIKYSDNDEEDEYVL